MNIFCEKTELYPKAFLINTFNSSYAFGISSQGFAIHLYYGPVISKDDLKGLCSAENSPWFPQKEGQTFLDHVPLEYSGAGVADLRPAAIAVQWEDGDNIADLRYHSHRIILGKPSSNTLPHIYTEETEEAKTLVLKLIDAKGLEVKLYYTVFQNSDAIVRRAVVRNFAEQKVTLKKVLSASVDFSNSEKDIIHLHGNWARECTRERMPIGHSKQQIDSFLGASGHEHNPFAAVVSKDCTETFGEAYGFSLIYSGNFCIETDTDLNDNLRVGIGLSGRDFRWTMNSSETFETPEAVLVYSEKGLGHMSRTYHKLYQTRLSRGYWRDRPRPVLLNTWEGVYFNFNRDKILRLAKSASEEGIELFVIDDGWFGHRNDDTSSLGDWNAWEEKLGSTLAQLANNINSLGMDFGIWVEPEMISPNSDLYRAHPDWVLCRPNRMATLKRHQLILDLSRKEVQDFIIDAMSSLFSSVPIAYVKWDMNRNMTEIGSFADLQISAGALAHKYMLGLYRVLQTLTDRFPKILFESCASGGGRFDPGMLYYMPQAWTSDDTDAIQRLSIQGGASLVYPTSMMSCHVSASPNHQVGRITPIDTRWNIAMLGGGFGYELDMTEFQNEEAKTVKKQIQDYKLQREILFSSKFYRLFSSSSFDAFQQISADEKNVVVTCCRKMYDAHLEARWLRLVDLIPALKYRNIETGEVFSGSLLMGKGIKLDLPCCDFSSERIVFQAE